MGFALVNNKEFIHADTQVSSNLIELVTIYSFDFFVKYSVYRDIILRGDLIQLKKQVVDSQSGKLNKDGFTTNSNAVIKKKAPLYFSFKGIATTKQAFMQALLGPEGEELAPYIDVVADKTGTKHGGNRGKSVRRV